jgi:hypothetical protein
MEPTNSVISVLLIYMSGGVKLQGTRKRNKKKDYDYYNID